MIRRAVTLTLSILWAYATCHAQVRMDLRDLSPKGSPLRTSGMTLFNDDHSPLIRYKYEIEASVRNVSNEGVIFMMIRFDSSGVDGPPLSFKYDKDYFFSSDVLDPGAVDAIRSSPLKSGGSFVNGQPVLEGEANGGSAPASTAQVIFVEFVDGTTWGDFEFARDSFVVRKQTLRELRRLENVLRDQGEEAFRNELSNSDLLLPCISSLVGSCRAKADSCLVVGVRSMIEAARHHQLDMKVEPHTLVDDHR